MSGGAVWRRRPQSCTPHSPAAGADLVPIAVHHSSSLLPSPPFSSPLLPSQQGIAIQAPAIVDLAIVVCDTYW